MYKRVLPLCALVIVFLLCYCNPCYYVPNSQNVPLFTEKKTATTSFSLQFGSYSAATNLQVAVACTDHIGLMLNYNHFWGGRSTTRTGFWSGTKTTTETKFKGNHIELGAGYFFSFEEKFVFEAYAGGGWGGVNNSYKNSSSLSLNKRNYVSYNRYFLQPAVGWSPNKYITLAFSTRFCLLDYNHLNIEAGDFGSTIIDLADIKNNPSYLMEPAFTFRVGGQVVKFQLQTVYSFMIDSPYASYDPLSITFGIFFKIKGKGEKDN